MGTFEDLHQLLEARGDEHYGEAVSKRAHALLTASAAADAGLAPRLVAAALLHDVGHLLGEADDWAGVHDHAELGGAWVEARLGAAVAGPVRLHVQAKRYLCAIEPGYTSGLSRASVHTLAHQGGPMGEDERRAFEAQDGWREALILRRLEDGLGKRAASRIPALEDYQALLQQLERSI